MLLRSWLAGWFPCAFRRAQNSSGRPSPRKRRLELHFATEMLEPRRLLTTIDMANPGSSATIIYGEQATDQSGYSVSGVGDVNGDGFDDFIIGARLAETGAVSTLETGEAYLVFGRSSFTSTMNLSSLGTGGVAIVGIDPSDFAGFSVSGAGDFNGDGFDDVVISAVFADAAANAKLSAGETYVVFGKPTFGSSINLSSLGSGGVTILGADAGDYSGGKVAGGGDVNGDGFDDIIIGAPRADGISNGKTSAGECYVVFGSGSPSTVVDLASLGSAGINIIGANAGDRLGYGASIAGDVNGDGIDDIAVGSPFASPTGKANAGKSYILFGSTTPQATIDLSNTASIGVTISGAEASDYSARTVVIAGDVNGDGFADLLLGAPGGDGPNNSKLQAGESYVVFGTPSLPASISLDTLGTNGVVFYGASAADFNGRTGAGAGDVNGDGFDDLILRGEDAPNQHKGKSFVLFGADSFASTVDLSSPNAAGITILGINTNDYSGFQVATAGDVNGDGYDDLLSGVPAGNGANNLQTAEGETYLIFGSNSFTSSVTVPGTSGNDTLVGDAVNFIINGGAGNDSLTSISSAAVMYGGNGDDSLVTSDPAFRRIDGGNGYDTLRLDGSGITLNLTTLADNRLTNIEAIDIRGSGSNSLILDVFEVLNVTATSNPLHTTNTLAIRRDLDDSIDMGPGWTTGVDTAVNGVFYHVYTQGAATLLIQVNPGVIDLADVGDQGVKYNGFRFAGGAGRNVSSAGDINGDGFDDFIVGASEVGNQYYGEFYVVFGSGTPDFNPTSFQSVDLWITGEDPSDFLGSSVSAAGDFNGDGYDDLIVGAFGADGANNAIPNAGAAYIILGRPSFPSAKPSRIDQLTDVVTINGSAGFNIGRNVSGLGDINGDGFDDVLMSSPYALPTGPAGVNQLGRSYVLFGRASPQAVFDAAAIGTLGITITGADRGDRSGSDISNAGDVNGDGFDDLLIGASHADGPGNIRSYGGEAYLIFGGPSLPTTIDLANMGSAGTTLFGADVFDFAGERISTAGDINGDGFDDLIVGAWRSYGPGNIRPYAGESFVVFGRASWPSVVDLANRGPGVMSILGVDEGDSSGYDVSAAGDVNGDGYGDLLIGARFAQGKDNADFRAGEAYLIFGGPSLPSSIDLAEHAWNGITFLAVTDHNYTGQALSSAGDFNGDGFDDMLISAPRTNVSIPSQVFDAGAVFLIYGGNFSNSVTHLGTAGANVLTGTSGANVINGRAGNDTLIGNGGADVIIGGQGDDILAISDTTFRRIDGGNGSDTLRLDGSGLVLNLTTLPENRLTNIETIDIRGSGANTLILGVQEVLNLTANSNSAHMSNTLVIRRNGDDIVDFGTGWTLVGSETINSELFSVYTLGAATLKIGNQAPVFTSTATATSPENQITVMTVTATDADVPAQPIFFYLFGGPDEAQFALSGSGLLIFRTAPDFENPSDADANNVYVIQVAANDAHGGQTIQTLSISVTGVNEFSPVFTSATTFTTSENSTLVGTITATDADLPAQTMTFSITGGADQTRFTISSGGLLRFSPSPDFENPTDAGGDNVYDVQVTANDGNGLSTVQNIAVTVTDANDPPIFTSTTFSIVENTTAVGTVSATDADIPAQTVTYSMTGGPDQGRFTFTAGGVLTFITAPDFENPVDAGTNNVYDVQITANDGHGGVTAQIISVTVTGANDNTPLFTSPSSFSVPENSSVVGNLTASDADLPQQTLIFSIAGGVDGALFSVTNNGELSFVVPPDFEHAADAGFDNVYNVTVTVSDGQGRSTVQSIAVTVTGVNDLAPVFVAPTTFNVPENSTAVGSVLATDADLPAQTVSYSLAGGADQAKFSITAAGVLTFVAAPDFENPGDANGDNVYELQVRASDSLGLSTVQAMMVTVTGVEEPPVFSSPASINVNENSMAVATITAIDLDQPPQVVSYSISGGADQARFSITANGLLTFLTPPDFEAPADSGSNNIYNIQITANDGAGGVTIQELAVVVQPLNDNKPVFSSPASFLVAENTTFVGTATATDADLPTQSVTYSITGGADQNKLTLGSSGTLQFISPPNFEAPADADADNVYELQITVDDGNGGLTTQDVTVNVDPRNDVPIFTSPTHFNVSENSAAVGPVVAADEDRPAQTLTYSINGGADQARFLITVAGLLSFVSAPDFEHPADADSDNSYQVQVAVSDGQGGTAVQNITVVVHPVNDNQPVFTSSAAFNVPENTATVGSVTATDADQPAPSIMLSISGGVDQARFSLNSSGLLTFVSHPDFEVPNDAGSDHTYELEITADDGDGGTTVQHLLITVQPVNDNSPIFNSPTTFVVAENSASVGTIAASDADLPAETITYTLSGGADQTKFVITPGGELTFLTPPDFDNPGDAGANNVYNLQVSASDGNGRTTLQNVTVTVTPINDYAPLFTSPASFNVAENSTVVGTLTATDGDLPSQVVTISITGGVDAGRFQLANGVLTFVAAPDFEHPDDAGSNHVYDLQVTANDGNGSLTAQNISVTVTPFNDNSPVFTSPVTFNVAENSAAVGTLTATDTDLPIQTLAFSITGGADQNRFSVTSGGVLTFIAPPDFEHPADLGANNVYDLQITVSDGNGGQAMQTISVTVTPINESPPTITSPAAFAIAENDSAVGTVVAIDSDIPVSIAYAITGGADQTQFAISATGALTFITAPDFENPADVGADNIYNLEITASDGAGGLTTQNITVTVTPLNDNSPVFSSSTSFIVSEISTTVGSVVATDADQPVQTITYSLAGGVDQSKFAISGSGMLTLVAPLDFEHPTDAGLDNVYNLQVTASDGHGKTTVQLIAVTVTAANDNLPVFTSPSVFNISENATAIGTVVATDADLPAQTITFSITGGADQPQFSITSGGVLTFVTAPDYESPTDAGANNIYEVQVTANDGNGGATVQNIIVTVSPLNDNSPVVTSSAAFNVPENTTGVGAVFATDADLPSQVLTYAITGGSDQSKFSITSGGTLTFIAAPDFEHPTDIGADNVYEVQVTATDGRGGNTKQLIAVTVTAVNDNSPVFTSPAVISVPENRLNVVTVIATDADLPGQTLTYSISGGVDQSRFAITSDGVLTFVTPPDFEIPADVGANNGYNVQVKASDGQGGSTVQNLAIIITNIDETAPIASIDAISPSPRNTPVDSITIRFSEIVTGFELSDLQLTRSGIGNLLDGTQSLTTQDHVLFTLSGLADLTGGGGEYELGLIAGNSGIADSSSNPLAADAAVNWSVDATPPSVSIAAVSPDPRTTAVNSLSMTFSEPVTGFGVSDLSLTRNGGGNVLTGFETLTTADNIHFELGNLGTLTAATGNYVLSLDAAGAGVQDSVGNLLAVNGAVSWNRINPVISLYLDHQSLDEASGTATVRATLSAATDVPVTIQLGFSGSAAFPADYSRSGTQIVIPAGGLSSSITLTAVPDGDFESAEAIVVDITSVTNAAEDGTQHITAQLVDDDHAPTFTSTATPAIPETSTTVMSVVAVDQDPPAQTIMYSITGGLDADRFILAPTGELAFLNVPDFEAPTDADHNNIYELRVTANDGHGGTTSQDLFVTVTDVNEAPELNLGGPDVTWIKRHPPAAVLPQVQVGGLAKLGTGTLTIQTNVVGSPKKLLDAFTFSTANIGTTSGPQRTGNTLTLEIQLKQNVTTSDIQAYLRGLTFTTKGKGLKTPTRNVDVTLADANGHSATVQQVIHVRKKP